MDFGAFIDRAIGEFPALAGMSVHIPRQGMDHVALVFGDEWVVRFPNRPEYLAAFPSEVRLLSYLQERLSLSIPRYTMIASDETFGAYPLIKGPQLSPEMYASLSPAAKRLVHSALARFLTELHRISIDDVRNTFDVRESTAQADLETVEVHYHAVMEPVITENERAACEDFFRVRRAQLAAAPHRVFVHGDLYWEHIIARENHDGLTGIIDFGDRAIGDPSFDFGELWAYGKKAVEAVYDQYEGPKDASFLVRSLYGYKRVGISAFVNALKGEYGTVEEMYRLFGETVQARYS